jgi:hypothetical protein
MLLEWQITALTQEPQVYVAQTGGLSCTGQTLFSAIPNETTRFAVHVTHHSNDPPVHTVKKLIFH